MRRLTRKQAIAKFREHWRWVAAEPGRNKSYYPQLQEDDPTGDCYLCEYVNRKYDGDCRNARCLVKWPRNNCLCDNSPYTKWRRAYFHDPKTAQKYAAKIAELPENVTASSK